VLQRCAHFSSGLDPFTGKPEVEWFAPTGELLTHETWHEPDRRAFAALIYPQDITVEDSGPGGSHLLLLFNTSRKNIIFQLPQYSAPWKLAFDTSRETSFPSPKAAVLQAEKFTAGAISVACLVLSDSTRPSLKNGARPKRPVS
jgi:pullulanase/glycogen debranching enzyme